MQYLPPSQRRKVLCGLGLFLLCSQVCKLINLITEKSADMQQVPSRYLFNAGMFPARVPSFPKGWETKPPGENKPPPGRQKTPFGENGHNKVLKSRMLGTEHFGIWGLVFCCRQTWEGEASWVADVGG